MPDLREVFVAGERAGAGMTLLSDLLTDPIETRQALSNLARLRPQPSDVAVFQLSGGTTGLPKVIPRTHDDYLYNSRASAAAADVDRDTVLLVTVPVSHNFPLACPGIQATLLQGGRVVLAPGPDAETVFRLVGRGARHLDPGGAGHGHRLAQRSSPRSRRPFVAAHTVRGRLAAQPRAGAAGAGRDRARC